MFATETAIVLNNSGTLIGIGVILHFIVELPNRITILTSSIN